MARALYSTGGILLFFPLFLQVDLPYKPSTSYQQVIYTPDPAALVQLVLIRTRRLEESLFSSVIVSQLPDICLFGSLAFSVRTLPVRYAMPDKTFSSQLSLIGRLLHSTPEAKNELEEVEGLRILGYLFAHVGLSESCLFLLSSGPSCLLRGVLCSHLDELTY
jgi:hypothetical protein